MNLSLNSAKAIGGGAIVVATINHGKDQRVSAEDFRAGVQNLAGHDMYALAGTFQVLDQSPFRTIVRGAMAPAIETLPFNEGKMQGFRSLSSSIYEDDKERMWSLHEDDNGKYLVRANTVDNHDEIAALLQSVCSSPVAGTDNHYFSAVASAAEDISAVQGGDAAVYLHQGESKFGIVVASVETNEGDRLVVLSSSGEVDTIEPEQVVSCRAANDSTGVGLDLKIPTALESESSSAAQTIETLVSYYQKVYGFNQTYFGKLEGIIRGHAWA